MKNIHVLPIGSKVGTLGIGVELGINNSIFLDGQAQNIYITNDEEIKEWYIYEGKLLRASVNHSKYELLYGKSVIQTTDQDLIKDGVQAIDDDFLEWFVKNPNCEEVEVIKYEDDNSPMLVKDKTFHYKIIIPKEELKKSFQEISKNCGKGEQYCEGQSSQCQCDKIWKNQYSQCDKIIIPKEELEREFVNNTSKWNMEDFEEPNYNMKQEILAEMERLEEEPKQETLEEYYLSSIKNMLQYNNDALATRFMEKYFEQKCWIEGRSYGEEDMLLAFEVGRNFQLTGENNFKELIKQLKRSSI